MSKNRLAGPAVAILITIGFITWMSSGAEDTSAETTTVEPETKVLIPSVKVVTSEAQTVNQTLEINGITEANRSVTVRSEANGRIIRLLKQQGDTVKRGEIIAQVDLQDIPERIVQATAFVEQTRLEYEGSKKLAGQGLNNEAQLARALANFEQAKAQLASLELQRSNTNIRAPFAGQIENLNLELGSFVQSGSAIADVYDYSKLTFVGAVSEKDISSLSLGQIADVKLVNGDTTKGTVVYIGSVTNPATRTFQVELEIDAVDRNVSGVTSVAEVDLGITSGHYISPALLYIEDSGEMGLKLLEPNNTVTFAPVSIIRSDTGGVWIDGLSESASIIVVGQGFVNIGDEAQPTFADFTHTVAVGL